MSADQIAPERIVEEIEDALRNIELDGGSYLHRVIVHLAAEVQRLTEEARRSDAGRVEVPDSRELALLRQHWQLWEEEVTAEDPAVFHDKANAREEVDALLREHMTRSRLSSSPQPATGADAFAMIDRVVLVSGRILYGDAVAEFLSRLSQPSADVEVVPREYHEALVHLRVCAHKWRHGEAPSVPLLNASVGADAIHAALRSSTNHDAQDAGEGG